MGTIYASTGFFRRSTLGKMTKPLPGSIHRSSSFDLAVTPIAKGETRQAWMARQVREQILSGALAVGSRVPSTRALAQRLGVGRSTVEVAFDQLRAEGYLTSIVGSGTYVSAIVPDRFMEAAPSVPARSSATKSLSMLRAETRKSEPSRFDKAFVSRAADTALFPMPTWRRHLQDASRHAGARELANDDPFGWLPLRIQIARYLGAARGIACDPAQVVVVSGIRHGLDLAARAVLRPSDRVLLEDPGYAHAMEIFGRYAGRVASVPIDDDGFSVVRARRHAGVRLVHVTPAHQSPTGLTMPVSRRLQLLDWAGENKVWVVEDDYDSEFSYRSAPLPALKNLDAANRVIHCGSFNKTIFTALRIGYVVIPEALVAEFAANCLCAGRSTGVVEQMALADFLQDGGFARHVRRSRAVYAQRRDRVLSTLRDALSPQTLDVSGEHGGFHFLWRLPPAWRLDSFLSEAAKRELLFETIDKFCDRAVLPSAVLIGDSALHEATLERALVALREVIRVVT